jgi:hypothetical protein
MPKTEQPVPARLRRGIRNPSGVRARRVAGALLAAATLLGTRSPGATGAPSAIQPANSPTPIVGAVNGELPAADLVVVARGCLLARAAAPSLSLLLAEARERGVVLGTEECYRPLAGQVTVAAQWRSAGNSACAAPLVTTPGGTVGGTSMHGWGKAADFSDAGGTVAFGSPGYRFLKTYAAQLGWNHPGWAEPGGGPCPEAWHWEWVGDGGKVGAPPIRSEVVGLLSSPGHGYATVTGLGAVEPQAGFPTKGDASTIALPSVVVSAASTPSGQGYWLAGEDGSVFAFGDAAVRGSTGLPNLNAPIVGIASTPTGNGYWLVASDGGIFTFGDARFHGSTGALHLNAPIVGIASTPTGNGYWLVASDGGIFTFGDAAFHGSTGALHLNAPIVGIASTPTGNGYWLVASDGGIFTFGDARFHGSIGASPPRLPVVAVTATADGGGYRITAADGSVSVFGDATA